MSFDKHPELQTKIEEAIRNKALPWLRKFIQIPNLSRNFDPEWSTNGLLEKACDLCLEYAKESNIKGLNLKYYRDEGKTPILFGAIDSTREGDSKKSIMFYGHLDKQPHLTEGWDAGLGPVDPVIKNGLLYGRGGVDDGYNFFTILAIVEVYQQLGIQHDRIVLFYECDEESSSRDIPHYLQKFQTEIGEPDVLFCLDSGSLSNQYFALTTTLRGCLAFDLKVRVLEKSMHSGVGSGIVPSTFRICRDLLERIECSKTGMIIDDLQVQIPQDKLAQVDAAVQIQGDGVHSSFCFCQGVKPVVADNKELYINNVWRSQLEIIGQKGIPLLHESGNVLREETILRGSLRLPPTLHTTQAADIIKAVLEKDPPYGAHVSVDVFKRSPGWNANPIPDNVLEILDRHNKQLFGNPTFLYGMGGSIPFINTMQDKMPKTLFFVSGLVLPDSAIHGPNESLDIEYWVKFSKSVGSFLVDYSHI